MNHLLRTIKQWKKLKTWNARSIYQNELDKACFQNDMVKEYFKHLPRRTGSDKVLRNKRFNIAKTIKYDKYQRGIDAIVYNIFDKKSSATVLRTNN